MTNLIKTDMDTTIATPAFAYAEQTLNTPNALTITIIEPPVETVQTPKQQRANILVSRGRRAKRRAGRH